MAAIEAERACAQAQVLLEAGQTEAGRAALVALVSAHPLFAEGWLLLSTVVDGDHAVDCLLRVLALDPDNAWARRWLPLAQRERARLAALKDQTAGDEDDVSLTEPGDDERPVPRLGQYLLDFKFVSAAQLKNALAIQRRARQQGEARRLGDVLLEQGAITQERLSFAVREQSRSFFSQFQS